MPKAIILRRLLTTFEITFGTKLSMLKINGYFNRESFQLKFLNNDF